ncbi:MAG TPA: hypothetical protein VL401_03290 [Alphaproteobacteria bacterium]|jgi:hypothetical protein|nr:hypothetical protein [Alphaproteobacteria bacterium]
MDFNRKWLIAILACLITVLVGVNGYLLYNYYVTSKSQITASGEIKPGWQLPQNQGLCANSYYLVSDKEIVEIHSPNLRQQSNQVVNIKGTKHAKDSTSCGNYITISSIEITSLKTSEVKITGTIACVSDEDGCTKSLQVGNAHLALTGPEVDLTNFDVGTTVTVFGITDNSFVSPQNFNGGIQVLSMEQTH